MKNPDKKPLLEFPCDFPIKIMGKANLDFQATALGIIRKYVPDLSEGAISTRYSKDNNYLSITVTILAQNQQQLDEIYKELSAHQDIMMVL
jgi:putative lipoic acid-binding regulatory protein